VFADRRLRFAALTVAHTLLGPAAAARAADQTYLALFGDASSVIGQQSQLFTPADATIVLRSIAQDGGTDRIAVAAQRSNTDPAYTIELTSPDGGPLRPGVYDDAGPTDQPRRPGLKLMGSGGCSPDAGRFEIRDIAADAQGRPSRLWLLFEYHCGLNPWAAFGEVRFNEPGPAAGADAEPAIARWPAAELGYARATIPVTIRAASALRVTSTGIDGPQAGDYGIRGDTCSGTSLSAGATCQVSVGLTPQVPGTRLATLHVREDSGEVVDVPLQSFTYGGTTRYEFHGGPAGDGQTNIYTPGNATLTMEGGNTMVRLREFSADDANWDAIFAPGQGDALHPGTYDNAARYQYNGSQPGMSIDGYTTACSQYSGHFTVTEATYNRFNEVRSFAVDFVEDCNGSTDHELRGSIAFRAGDTTVRPPWMGGRASAGEAAATPAGPGAAPAPTAGASNATAKAQTALINRLRGGLTALRRLTFTLPAGRLRVGWRDGHGHVLARGRRTWRRVGRQTILLKLTNAGRRELRGGRRLRVKITATFRPAAKGARTTSVTKTLRVHR
jgi:hypothetical protein